MSPNGRFTAQLNLKGTDVPQTLTGTWKVRGDKMIWVYEQDLPQLKKGQPDVNLILDPGPSSFVLVELDNTRTLYVKQKSSQ